MAIVTGFGLAATHVDAEDETPMSVEEELARKVISRLRTEHHAAALAAAVDLVNVIAEKYNLTGGAFL